jgi:hypothetical protein
LSDEQPTDAAPQEDATPKPNGVLVPQPHGGALKRGGVHARAGRPPNLIRAEIRADFDEMRADLKEMFFAKRRTSVKVPDRIRIAELFARYGFDESLSRSDVAAALQGTIEDIRSFLEPHVSDEQALELLAIIRQRWRGI